MKSLSVIIITTLALWALTVPAQAKQSLPVTVRCNKISTTAANVVVTLKAPATSLIVSVGGTGSVVTEKTVHQTRAASKSQEITVPVAFTAGSKAGGLVVEVRGDFGHGVRGQIQTFSLVKAPTSPSDDVRSRADGVSPNIIIIPAKTSTQER